MKASPLSGGPARTALAVVAGVAVVLAGGLLAWAVTSRGDGSAPAVTTTTLPRDPVGAALSGPGAAVADPDVVRAIRTATDCTRLQEMLLTSREAARRFQPDDPRQSNAVFYLNEVQERMRVRQCAGAG